MLKLKGLMGFVSGGEGREKLDVKPMKDHMRKFKSGATRNLDTNKYSYIGFFDPMVLQTYASYMHKHRKQADGTIRPSDNWKKGIPMRDYMESLFRHFVDIWKLYCGYEVIDKDDGHIVGKKEVCCAIMFNVMGYLFELIKEERK